MCLEFFEVGPNLFWYENEVTAEMASFLWDVKILQRKFERCWVCLRSVYFAKTEIFLLKVLYIKVKVNWNNTMWFLNNTKKHNETYK